MKSKTNYKCYRCNDYSISRFTDIKNHFCKKYPCPLSTDRLSLSNDQLLVMTVSPYINDIHTANINELQHLSHSNMLFNNKEELFLEVTNINNSVYGKTCKYCEQKFFLISDFRKHFITECFFNELSKKYNNNNTTIINNIDNSVTNIDNSVNNTYNINNNNNINLVLQPIPFEQEWDLSQISQEKQVFILMSDFMYSNLLEEILQNKQNNNVIIDSDSNTGVVYLNHDQQYTQMKVKNIAQITMEKLHNELNIMNRQSKPYVKQHIFLFNRNEINYKLKDYNENSNINKGVNDVFTNIYGKYVNVAKSIAKDVEENNSTKIKQTNIPNQYTNKQPKEVKKGY